MKQNMDCRFCLLKSLSKVCINILSGCCFSDQLKPKELSSKVLSQLKSFKTSNGEVFGGLFLFCSSHLKVQRLKVQTLQVNFINIGKTDASSSFSENMLLSHNMLMSSGAEYILVRRPIAHLFWEIILRYLSMVLSWVFCLFFQVFCKMVDTLKLF